MFEKGFTSHGYGTRRSLALAAAAAGLMLGLTGAPRAADPPKDPHYVGWQKCKMCHLKQFKSWEQTPMGKAFETLKPGVKAEAKTAAKLDPQKDYTKDPACVKCHVTGFGKPGGYQIDGDEKANATLVNVGCESCHGPGSAQQDVMKKKDYKRADALAAGMVEPDEQLCRTCHNEESPTFKSFTYDKEKGIHEHIPLKNPH